MTDTPKPSENPVNAAAYAEHAGVTKARVSQWVGSGMPAVRKANGQYEINVASADAWRAANLAPKMGPDGEMRGLVGGDAEGSSGPSSAERIQASKATIAESDARRALIREHETAGRLIDRRASVTVMKALVGQIATQIERMPEDCAADLAAELGVPRHAAFKALQLVANRMREDIARYADEQRERVPAYAGGGSALGSDSGSVQAEAQA